MFHMFGPDVGRRHDLTLYRDIGLGAILEEVLLIDGKQYCLYGDVAYMVRPWLQTAFSRLTAMPLQAMYKNGVSEVRVTVE